MKGDRLRNQIVEDLRRVREELLTHGWTQHTFTDKQGRRCLLGAIGHCVPENRLTYVIPVIWNAKEDQDVTLTVWNDRSGRTIDDVIALIDKAIEAQGSTVRSTCREGCHRETGGLH